MVGASSIEDFIDWLIDDILLDPQENEDNDLGAFAELACRRLVKLGYLKVEDECYMRVEENNYEEDSDNDSDVVSSDVSFKRYSRSENDNQICNTDN